MDYVIDIETLGKGSDAPIIQIGLCSINMDTLAVGEREFDVTLDLASACAFGAKPDGDTIRWWLGQNDAAREPFASPEEQVEARTAAALLLQFLAADDPNAEDGHEFDNVVLWGNGPSFDCTILANFMARMGVVRPWKHWNERCVRTILALYPEAKAPFPSHRTKHNALDDAKHEADCIALALSMHRAKASAAPGADEEG